MSAVPTRRSLAVMTMPVPSALRLVPACDGLAGIVLDVLLARGPEDPHEGPLQGADVVDDGQEGGEGEQQGELAELGRPRGTV